MKKLYKLTNIKLNQSFWIIIVAFILQIIAGVVISLTSTEFSSTINPPVHIVSNIMFDMANFHGQITSAMWTVIPMGILISIFAILRCDIKFFRLLGVNRKENTISNICVGVVISVVVSLILIISQVTNLLVVRLLDGYWLSPIADGDAIAKLIYQALLCALATFTIYTLLITIKQLFARYPRIGILVSAAIIVIVLLFMFGVIGGRSLREVMFTKVGGIVSLIISGAIFTTLYCCAALIGEIKI